MLPVSTTLSVSLEGQKTNQTKLATGLLHRRTVQTLHHSTLALLKRKVAESGISRAQDLARTIISELKTVTKEGIFFVFVVSGSCCCLTALVS